MKLTNKYIDYVSRSYEQIKSSILTRVGNEVPELKDHNENSFFVRMVSVWAGLMEMVNYYINNVVNEMYLVTAKRLSSVINFANMFNFPNKLIIPAQGSVVFTFDKSKQTNLPANVKEIFFLKEESLVINPTLGIYTGSDNVSYPLRLLESFSIDISGTGNIFTSSKPINISQTILKTKRVNTLPLIFGIVNQQVVLEKDVNNVVAVSIYSPSTGITNLQYVSQPTYGGKLADQLYQYSIYRTPAADAALGIIPGISIILSLAAAKAVNGDSILNISYSVSTGSKANNLPNKLVEWSGSINYHADPTSTVKYTTLQLASKALTTNEFTTTMAGGSDAYTIDEYKTLIPKHIQTLKRGVTLQDVNDLVSLDPLVETATALRTNEGVDIYIIAYGRPAKTSAAFKATVLDNLLKAMQQMVLVKYTIKDVPSLPIDLVLRVKYTTDNEVSTIKQTVINNLTNYFKSLAIKETIAVGNIYEVVENTPSVSYSDKLQLTADTITGALTDKWDIRQVKIKAVNNIVVNKYTLTVILVNESVKTASVRLHKNGIAIGDTIFTVTTPKVISTSDFEFTIYWKDSTYVVGSPVLAFDIHNKDTTFIPEKFYNYIVRTLTINTIE